MRSRTSAGFWLGKSVPLCHLRRRKFWKFDYEMVHFEVYLNKYVVSIAPFSTPACPDCSQNITYTHKLLFCIFSLFNFSSIFSGGQLTPFAPMCARPCMRYNTCLWPWHTRRYNVARTKHAVSRVFARCQRCSCCTTVGCRKADRPTFEQIDKLLSRITYVDHDDVEMTSDPPPDVLQLSIDTQPKRLAD